MKAIKHVTERRRITPSGVALKFIIIINYRIITLLFHTLPFHYKYEFRAEITLLKQINLIKSYKGQGTYAMSTSRTDKKILLFHFLNFKNKIRRRV